MVAVGVARVGTGDVTKVGVARVGVAAVDVVGAGVTKGGVGRGLASGVGLAAGSRGLGEGRGLAPSCLPTGPLPPPPASVRGFSGASTLFSLPAAAMATSELVCPVPTGSVELSRFGVDRKTSPLRSPVSKRALRPLMLRAGLGGRNEGSEVTTGLPEGDKEVALPSEAVLERESPGPSVTEVRFGLGGGRGFLGMLVGAEGTRSRTEAIRETGGLL